MEIPEPITRPLDSLPEHQRNAIKVFQAGGNTSSFNLKWGWKIVIKEDPHAYLYWLSGRSPLVEAFTEEGQEIMSATVQDAYTHIAHQVNHNLEAKSKWIGTIVRDTVEAIIGIPPFETARLGYLIIFLIKRGYVPVWYINGKGLGSHGLLYKQWLEQDIKLEERDLENIIRSLRELYEAYIAVKWTFREKSLRKTNFRNHIRLQYNPIIAGELWEVIQKGVGNFYNKIDELVEKILQIAYNKK